MSIPSSLYNTDTIATHGTTEIELTKEIEDLYPAAGGNIDNSIAYTKYNASWLYTAGVTCYPYEDGGSSVKFAEYEPDSSYCYKYYNWESDVPITDANVNVCIIAPGSTAGYYYINSESIIDYGINDSRFVRNAQTNKMLFTAQARRINLTELEPYELERGSASHVFPLQTVDLKYIDSHPDEYFYDFSLTGCLVWDGSDWITASYVPAYISTSSSSQGVATINTCFNRRGIYYDMDVRQDSELYIHEDGSSDGFEANGATGWSLGWPEDVEVAPYYIGIGDMANLNALIEAEIEGEETRIDIITCQRAIPVNEIWYYFTWCSGVYYNHPDGVRNASHSSYYCPCIKGSTLSKLIAGCGLYFLADPDADLTGITPNNLGNCADIWLGEMNGDFTTTGNWIKGANINSYTGANREGNVFNGGFDPSKVPSGGGTDEDEDTAIATAAAPYAKGLVNYYAMTAGSPLIDHISEALSTWDLKNTGKDLYKNLVSCKLIKPPAPIPTTGSEPFTIYGEKPQYEGADISLPVVSGNPDASFGPYKIPRKFYDFRDYAPYTRVCIYIPYCGWCDLPSHVVGRSVTVKYFTDIIAATVRAVVFCNNNIIAEAAGVMGLDIPFTADAVGMKQAGVVSGLTAYAGGALQTAAGVASIITTKGGKGIGETLSGVSKLVSAYTQTAIAFNENTTEISGKNGDGCCLSGATNIIIKIIRPKYGASSTAPFVPAGFAHSIGFVSNKQVRVGNVSGLLIADNVDTSGIAGATDAERAEIKRVLETGLIVNAAPE